MYFDNYISFWNQIVVDHPGLSQFYRLNHDEVDDALRNTIQYPALVLNEYDGEINRSNRLERFFDVQKGSFLLLDIIKPQDYNDEQAKLNELKKIGFQIFGKIFAQINEDIDNTSCPKLILGIDPYSIKYYLTPWMLEHVRGWLFEFKMKETATEFIYNPTDWQ